METDTVERAGSDEYREVEEVSIEDALADAVGSNGDSRFLPRFLTSGSSRGEMVIRGSIKVVDESDNEKVIIGKYGVN